MYPPPKLESARLILDAFRQEDAEALFAYASQPSVAKWMAWAPHQTIEESRDALTYLTSDTPGQFEWAIRLRNSSELVGGFTFLRKKDNVAEIHFTVAESHWRRGIATEVGRIVIDWAWRTHPDLSLISTAPVAENIASRKVLERLGFVAGAVRRSGFHKFSGGIDVIDYRLQRNNPDKAMEPAVMAVTRVAET